MVYFILSIDAENQLTGRCYNIVTFGLLTARAKQNNCLPHTNCFLMSGSHRGTKAKE